MYACKVSLAHNFTTTKLPFSFDLLFRGGLSLAPKYSKSESLARDVRVVDFSSGKFRVDGWMLNIIMSSRKNHNNMKVSLTSLQQVWPLIYDFHSECTYHTRM